MIFKREILKNITVNITDGEHGSVIDDPYGDYYLLSNKNIINGKIKYDDSDRIISKSSFEKISKRTKLQKNDVVLSTVGTIGKAAIICENDINFDFQRSVGIIKCDLEKILPEYLYYYFNQNFVQKRLINVSKGAVQKCLFINDLENLIIDLPSDINFQKQIVSILSSIDTKIELNNRINAKLEAMAKTVYDYWFVQFDFPVSDSIEGATPSRTLNNHALGYKSSGGKMVWSEELKREVPEGWKVGELKDIANITMGQSPAGESYNEDRNGMVFYQGCTDFGTRFPTIRKYTTEPTRFARQGDILLSVRAPVGTLNISKEDCCIGRGLAALNSKDNCIAYLFGVMVNLKQIFDRRNVDGTTFGSITKDDLFTLKVVKPSNEVLQMYHKLINPCFEKQNLIAEENQQLSSLRDWLLPMLMNGQVSVGEAEQESETLLAAEPKTDYKCSKSQWEHYHKIESVYAILWANKLLGVQQGEMALAKDTYMVDKLAGIETGYTFAQHNWGSYDPTFKKTINNKQYFVRRNFENSKATYFDLNDNEKLLARIPETTKEAVRKIVEELHSKVFYKYQWSKKAEMKELYATVLKCIEDTQSIDLNVIRQAMKDWKTPKQDFPDKAAKFSEQQTKEALDMIVKEGWALKVMKD